MPVRNPTSLVSARTHSHFGRQIIAAQLDDSNFLLSQHLSLGQKNVDFFAALDEGLYRLT